MSASGVVAKVFGGLLTVVLLGVAMSIMAAAPASAVPAAPGDVTLTQPDNSVFVANQWGDEWLNGWETDGYTIIQAADGSWRYAILDGSGRLRPGAVLAQNAPPAGLERHLRPLEAGGPDGDEPQRGDRAAPAPNTGTQPVLVILAKFPNQGSSTTEADWAAKFFGPTNSVRDYYNKVSYSNLSLPPAAESSGTTNNGIIDWVTIGYNHPNTADLEDSSADRTLAKDALVAADSYVDYSAFDTDNDNSISTDELHIVVIVAGNEGSDGSCGGNQVWGHNWTIFNYQGGGANPPTLDGVVLGSWGSNGGYSMFGEKHCSGGSHQATIGIMVHEIGHDLALPDLYDVIKEDGESEGVGDWSVMGSGSWNRVSGYIGSMPPFPDPFSRIYQGWITPEEITGTQTRTLWSAASSAPDILQAGANPNGVDWKFNNSSGTGEYFLIENRQKVGYDAGLPGDGVLIWHIDESRPFRTSKPAGPGNDTAPNGDETHKLVDVEAADGQTHMDDEVNQGDTGDPFPGSANNTVFGGATTPNSNWYNGSSSGITVDQISASQEFMSVRVTAPCPDPLFNDNLSGAKTLYGVASDTVDNSCAGAESGEPSHDDNAQHPASHSVWWGWTAPISGPVTVDTNGSEVSDTVLGIYTGTSVTSLTTIGKDDDSGDGNRSEVVFTATAGTTYKIAVDAFSPTYVGDVTVNISCPAPFPDNFPGRFVRGEFTDTESNGCASIETGEIPHDPTPVSTAPHRSLWWNWESTFDGPVVVDTFGTAFDTVLGVYTAPGLDITQLTMVDQSDDAGGTLQSEVSFTAVSGQFYRFAVDSHSISTTGEVTINLACGGPPANDDFGNAIPLGPAPSSATGNNTCATVETGEPYHGKFWQPGDFPTHSLWWEWTPPSAGELTVDTFGTTLPGSNVVHLAVYAGPDVANLTTYGRTENSEGSPLTDVEFGATGGVTYKIAVDSPLGYNGNVMVNLDFVPCLFDFTVNNQAELDDAVSCYNRAAAGTTTTITFGSDFTAGYTEINNTTTGPQAMLVIEGAGRTLTTIGTAFDVESGDVSINELTTSGGLRAVKLLQGSLSITDSSLLGHSWRAISIYDTSAVTITNTTISGNFDEGLHVSHSGGPGNVVVTNTTIVDTTGNGIETNVAVTLVNSLVARSGGSDCDVSPAPGGSILDGGGNTIEDGTCGSIPATAGLGASLAPSPDANGCVGPCTHTVALLWGSPAVDAAGACGLAADQRGVVRPQGPACDSGSFEREPDAFTGLPALCEVYDSQFSGDGLLTPAGGPRMIPVHDVCGIPDDASAVMLTVTAKNPQGLGNLRLSAAGVAPAGGVVNYTGNGLNNTNTVTVPLSLAGAVDVASNNDSSHVRLVAAGYYSAAGAAKFIPLTPCAVADSRTGINPASGAFVGPFAEFGPYPDIDVVGTFSSAQGGGNTDCGVPVGADAVVVNVVSVASSGSGGLALGPGGSEPLEPTTNFNGIGLNNAAVAVVPLNGGQTVALNVTSAGTASTHVRLVVLGYMDSGNAAARDYIPVNPCAGFDSRTTIPGDTNVATGPFAGKRIAGASGTTTYRLTGTIPAAQGGETACGVPDGASAVLINLVAIQPDTLGNYRAYASGSTPTGGVLNFALLSPATINSNAVVVPLSALGDIDLFVNAPSNDANPTVHARGVILGYYT